MPHSIFRAFRHRNFLLFFTGQSISMVGTWSQILAISWLVWGLTGSAFWLGMANFANQLPMLLFGLIGGVAADRFDRLKALNLMQILCMLQAIVLGIITYKGVVELWHIILLSTLLGVVYAFEFPIRLTFVADMVGKEDLLNAVSLNAAMFHSARILGPVAAGMIVTWKGESTCFMFNAATFLFLITALFFIKRSTLEIQSSSNKDTKLIPAIMEGLRHMWGNRESRLALILVAFISGIGMQFTTLMPIFADQVYKGSAIHLGGIMGIGGIGSLSGALWLARRKSHNNLLNIGLVASIVFSIAISIFSLIDNFYFAMPAITIAGFFLTIFFSSINTLLQRATPDNLRGRIMSLFTITFVGFMPFGSLFAGIMASEIGAQLTLFACGVICLLVGVAARLKSR